MLPALGYSTPQRTAPDEHKAMKESSLQTTATNSKSWSFPIRCHLMKTVETRHKSFWVSLNWNFLFFTPWPQSASELYRPSDRSLSAKLVPTYADRW
jgi:hypothetical protein